MVHRANRVRLGPAAVLGSRPGVSAGSAGCGPSCDCPVAGAPGRAVRSALNIRFPIGQGV